VARLPARETLGGGFSCLVLSVLHVDLYSRFCSYLQSKLRVLNNEKMGDTENGEDSNAHSLPCGIRHVG